MGIMCKVSIIEYSVHGECEGGKRSMGKGGERNKVEKMNGKKKRKEKKWKSKRKVEQGRAKKSGICTKCKREMGKNILEKEKQRNVKQLNKKISSMNVLDSFQI
jgi:hypothetical protein